MLANIMGSFISVLIGFTLMQYAWEIPDFFTRLGFNTAGLLPMYIGLIFVYDQFVDLGILKTRRIF